MKTALVIFLTFISIFVKGQITWNFTNKLYIVDSTGKIDSVLFGNHSSATIGVDTLFGEQNIFSSSWDSLEIRSIHRTSDSVDCAISSWSRIFDSNLDLKKDIRKNKANLDSSTLFVFKIHAINYPIEVYQDFSDMYNYSKYNDFTRIILVHYKCLSNKEVTCTKTYNHLFTIADSTERYIIVLLDYEVSVNDLKSINHKIILNNPVDNLLLLEYSGHIQIFEISGKLLLETDIIKNEPINVEYLKAGLYFIKTKIETFKMIKL